MTEPRNALERIADALERLAPSSVERPDWLSHPAYVWDGCNTQAVATLDAPHWDVLRGIDQQKQAVADNIERLATGAAAHDMLLWGSRGMGKSALIRSACAKSKGAVALIQIAPGSLNQVAELISELAGQQRAFLLFVDDLGFGADQTQDNFALRSLLDGGVIARPSNVRLTVTSNRRNIVHRENGESQALHDRDERDNALALADRFGLTLAFHPCDQATYLEILRAYTAPLSLDFDEEEALAWAIDRGNRSGRTAYQFACELAGRAGVAL